MNDRLNQFLAAENINQSQFADSIGVARASISHILSGRNKPGYDFIENTMKRYPALNIEWLLTGRGRMYKTAESQDSPSLFKEEQAPAPVRIDEEKREIAPLQPVQASSDGRRIKKIIVFYDDGTYGELS